ncbi:YHYH protein [Tistlia consotensis]|uniref:YHYH protein n=1 Tax=Tistlia consotensis USBA 355 TaxID=560819 RepID=A0A1Y6B9P1_9PROT|nr:YHYH protein [Tistlia consotensis]SMF00227.1 YHYH protein [Tistlia consotensis USBA 355]SNR76136.1 YHYH protein [Tistlia consotensis]
MAARGSIGLAVLALVLAAAASAAAQEGRPLGDGRISPEPRTGYLFSCLQRFDPNAGGARRSGPWIVGDRYDPERKPTVEGEVAWPNARIEISLEGDERVVRANDLPSHPTGRFPIASSDPAWRYDRNPNRIREQQVLLRLPAQPQLAAAPSCLPMQMIGFALTGVAIFNALDGGGRDAPAHEILDACGGHPERDGTYHYHDLSPCMGDGHDAEGHSLLLGYALDGFGIYGPKDVGGRPIADADLDACHGHVGPVLWDGRIRRIYHYHMTEEYPYSLGCFRGTPVGLQGPSQRGAGPSGAQAGPGGPGDPLAEIARELDLDPVALRRAVGPPPPDLQRAARLLGVPLPQLRAAFARHRPR